MPTGLGTAPGPRAAVIDRLRGPRTKKEQSGIWLCAAPRDPGTGSLGNHTAPTTKPTHAKPKGDLAPNPSDTGRLLVITWCRHSAGTHPRGSASLHRSTSLSRHNRCRLPPSLASGSRARRRSGSRVECSHRGSNRCRSCTGCPARPGRGPRMTQATMAFEVTARSPSRLRRLHQTHGSW